MRQSPGFRVSRFHDEVWDFSNENQNPATDKPVKRIRWAFEDAGRWSFTDPSFRRLLLASKQFVYALRWHPLDSVPFASAALCQARSGIRSDSSSICWDIPIQSFDSKMYCPTTVRITSRSCWIPRLSMSYKYALPQYP